MLEVAAALKAAEELDKSIGLIGKLVGKLKTQPDLAAQKLGQALGEIAKTLLSVDNAAAEYLSLGIDDGALAKNSKQLLEIEGGLLSTEVRRGLGHCHRIGNIYHTYLDKWFQRVLDSGDYSLTREVFAKLESADGGMFDVLASVATTLEQEATVVIDLIAKRDEAGARARVLSAMSQLRPLRKTISKTMSAIYSLQSEFVDITGIV
jgi:hypothetical protein